MVPADLLRVCVHLPTTLMDTFLRHDRATSSNGSLMLLTRILGFWLCFDEFDGAVALDNRSAGLDQCDVKVGWNRAVFVLRGSF